MNHNNGRFRKQRDLKENIKNELNVSNRIKLFRNNLTSGRGVGGEIYNPVS